ncbi:MAG: TonB family protein [Bacteroidales bacterium]|nr:TonB family protein [Bacteroidales bacterium]
MEQKKHPKANLENYRGMFFLVGLVFSLLLVFVTINKSQADVIITDYERSSDMSDDGMIIINTTPPEEKIKAPKPKLANLDILEIVDNDKKLPEIDLVFEDPNKDVIFDPFKDDDPFKDPFEDDSVYLIPSTPAVFSGGDAALNAYIAKNVDYPEIAIENEIQGTVYLRFVITKTGKVGEVQVLNRGRVDEILIDEAVRVIQTLPDFTPGYNNGRPVNVWMSVPIIFELN